MAAERLIDRLEPPDEIEHVSARVGATGRLAEVGAAAERARRIGQTASLTIE
jgi:hypothetical protein